MGHRIVPKTMLVAPTVCNGVTDDSAEATPTSLSSVLSFISSIYMYFPWLAGCTDVLEDTSPAACVGGFREHPHQVDTQLHNTQVQTFSR